MIPNYLCIGVQKSGTTSLINYLNLHPKIFCKQEEQHFFDRESLTDEDYDNYQRSFVTNKTIVGEKTPAYCYLQYAMNRIYEYNRNMKLILILREPISRAYSQYNMELSRRPNYNEKNIYDEFEKEENVSLSSINRNGDYYIVRGYYDEQIKHILTMFDRSNLLICIAEEIIENKQFEYNKIYNFLGVDSIEIDNNLDIHIGTYKKQIPKELELMLYNIYHPHVENLYEILGRRIEIWENYYNNFR